MKCAKTRENDRPPPTGNFEPKAGVQKFTVSKCFEGRTSSGKEALKVEVEVPSGGEYPHRAFGTYILNGWWDQVIHDFCDSIGIPYTAEADEAVGRSGLADFKIVENYSEKNQRTYKNLEIVRWVPEGEAATPAPKAQEANPENYDYGPPPMGDDDAPF